MIMVLWECGRGQGVEREERNQIQRIGLRRLELTVPQM